MNTLMMFDALRKQANRYRVYWLLCIFCVSILVIPQLAGSALVNWSNALLLRTVLHSELPPNEHPHHALGTNSRSVFQALDLSRWALVLDPNSPSIQWSHGRTALAAGLYHEAARVLLLDDSSLRRNSLRYLDALVALSYAGDDDRVIQLSESSMHSGLGNEATQKAIIVAYLRKADVMLRDGAVDEAIAYLEQVVSSRPNDIYANFLLWRTAVTYGNLDAADRSRQRLQFPTIIADDERLLELASEVVPELLTSGLWSTERGHAVLSFWTWRYPEIPAVAQLAHTLMELFQMCIRDSEYVAQHGLWLPSSSFLQDGDVNRICMSIRAYFQGSR